VHSYEIPRKAYLLGQVTGMDHLQSFFLRFDGLVHL